MKTSITLQEPFSYSLLPIIVLSVLVLSCGMYLFCSHLRKKAQKKTSKKQETKTVSNTDLAQIKRKYLAELERILQAAQREEITTRTTYQNMSGCIRQFVYEITGIKVQNYTLLDIKKLQMPHLESLIAEFYHPEFAVISQGNIDTAYQKAKRIIELWN